MEKRYSQGITLTGSYTFSRLIDDAGAVFDSAIQTGPVAAFQAADSHNRRLEKSVSTGNIPHNFSGGVVWDLPGSRRRGWGLAGWQIAGIARWQSGSPVAVTQQPNLNSFAGFGIQRPNLLRDPKLPGDARSTGRWFDTTAFMAAPQFALGAAERNPVRGPGYRTLDLMVGKGFVLSEPARLEFRAEAFNVTNTPPLGQLATVRKRRGIGAAALAQRVGVSRQTIYAIEAGDFVPNTEITLRLARELETSVEELFSLGVEPPAPEETIETVLLASRVVPPGHAARICRVGERMVSVPAMPLPYYLPAVDGVIVKKRAVIRRWGCWRTRCGEGPEWRWSRPARPAGLRWAGCGKDWSTSPGYISRIRRAESSTSRSCAGSSRAARLPW